MSHDNHNINIPNFPSINEDDLPAIPILKILNLQIFTQCNIHSLSLILHCMSNLQELSLTLVNNHMNQWLIDSFINGNNWQRMLTGYVANLKVFDFHMSFLMDNRLLDLNLILNSFRYFVTHYNGWHMGISRWITYEDIGPHSTHSYRSESHQYVSNLSALIDLSSITNLEFEHSNDLSRSYVAPYVLLACINVTKLIMRTSLFFSSIVIDNPNLSLTFARIKALELISDHIYVSLKHGSKIVDSFPSLSHVEIEVYSLDSGIPIVDIFLCGLKMLRHIIVTFSHKGLADDTITQEHIIEKWRQSFGLNRNDEYKVVVKIEDHTLYIWIP
ncbi:unnamed protein product [Adineta steineri]|uniref:Uncharacterized protein n=1 Tax=Adineta steineri TaxID=433720 RepID=A0A815L321_9BILA|nr:unnamed protein product [Adineta steineri]CAF1615177.1 unnamed protein product [Adineta steineri]